MSIESYHASRFCNRFGLASSLTLLFVLGCQAGTGEIKWPPPDPSMTLAGVPVPGVGLNRLLSTNQGLLKGVDGRTGYPVIQGEAMDPLILEARRFYDVVKSPRAQATPVSYPDPFTGAPPGPRRTAPLSFETWKAEFGFPARDPGETLDRYRRRTAVVTYYNRNELGLGRELACADFVDGADPNGAPIKGLACYVTNYGSVFRDERNSLIEAMEGKPARNTVCITWRPSMEPGYEVQFYVYGADGLRIDYAQLDNFGPRPHPHVCMSCHGGVYDEAKHLAKNARFLPLDPNVVVFSKGPATPYDRASQEERIRIVNAASLRTPLTPAQQEMLHELYGGAVTTPGTVSRNIWVPVGWRGSQQTEAVFDQVVKPYCGTCHFALEKGMEGSVLMSYALFRSPAELRRFPLSAVLCGSFSMPNAQPTLLSLWNTPVQIGPRSFATAADALLDWMGIDWSSCAGLPETRTCNRGPDPDALCGNSVSGTACNRTTGRCQPDFAPTPSGQPAPRGLCRTDGSRNCPPTLECAYVSNLPEGLRSFDGVCVPAAGG